MPIRFALATLLLFATPALAQRIDTRVDDVTETPDGYSCRSHALPDLRLSHDWRGGDRAASWDMPAREAIGGAMRVTFVPDPDRPFGAATSVLGFQLDFGHAPLRTAPVSAHLRVDGQPNATVLGAQGDAESVTLAVVERQREDLAARLMDASIVEIDLVDASGAPLGRYSWDVRKLRRAPELLQVINWMCRPPDP